MIRTIISLFGVALLFSFATVANAEWTVLREDDILRGDGIEGMLHDVYFMDNQNGLVVGDNGLILVTTDGGTTWGRIDTTMRPPGAGQRGGGRPGAGGGGRPGGPPGAGGGPPGAGGGPPAGMFGGGAPAPFYHIYL